MKRENIYRFTITYLLTLCLIFGSFLQITFAGHPKVSLSRSNTTKITDDDPDVKTSSSQQQVLDAATKNFLKGLSGTRLEVAKIVIDTVNRAGGKVVGLGSWISGKNYLDPILNGTSDHDLRVVFEGSEELAIARYRTMRREIIKRVRQQFGANADKVLKSINLYPPEVILEGLDEADDALRKLMDLGINTNLGDAVTEGVWGKGAKAFRDATEAQAGRVIWKEGNMVRSGFADLLPVFGENAGIYTIQGSANSARQFVDKVDDALKAGDAKSVRKSLIRLRNSLKKGRDLSALNKTSYLDDLLQKLDDCCQGNLEKLSAEINNPVFRVRLAKSLQRAKFEAELLLRYAAETNPQHIQIIREMLQAGTGKWSRVKAAFLKYSGKVAELGGKVRWDLAFKGFFAILTAYQIYDYYKKITEADLEGILQNALIDATLLVSAKFVIGFVPLILKAIIDDAIDYGYALITAAQDCQNLLAGIYQVKGRENLEPNQKLERSIDQLATQYTEERKVLAIIAVHARNATMRNGKEDPKAEKLIYDRCSTEIINQWRWRRIEIIGEAIDVLKKIEREFNSLQLIGSVNPQEVWVLPEQKATIKADASLFGDTSPIQRSIVEFTNKIKSIGGEDKIVAVDIRHVYQWIPGTEDVNLASPNEPIFNPQRASENFDFQYTGQIPLKFEYGLEIKVQTTADDVFSVARSGHLNKKLLKSVSFNVNVLAPQGIVEIIAPAQTEAGKPVNLTAKLDDDLKKVKDYRLVWQDLSGSAIPKMGNSYSFTLDDGGTKSVRLEVWAKLNGVETKIAQSENTITVEPKDKQDEEETAEAEPTPVPSPEITKDSKPAKLMFGGTASNIWEGTNDERGFRLKRQSALSKGTGYCKWEAHVLSEIWGNLRPSFAPRSPEGITKKIQEFAAESKRWSKTSTAKSFSIGEFKGQFSETNIKFRGGGASPDAGYRADSISAEGRSWIIKDNKTIEIGYNISGGGCWDNSDRTFLERQANAAQKEANAIINSLTLTGGDFSKIAYTGPKLDGSDMPTVELIIDPNRKKLKKGEIVEVQAVVKNTDAEDQPIKYEWTGDHGGKGAKVQFIAEKPGKQSLSVTVNGAKYQIGTASVEFEIADLTAEIKQLSTETKVTVGVPVSFSAELLSEGKPVSGNYIYRFQPSPEVEFETNESANKQTIAKFTKPGREKVWVQILEQKGDSLETVAESQQIEIEVIEPELKITFDQKKALVGKAVKAKVDIAPADLKNIDFRWEISSNAKQTLESQDGKEITFVPQNSKPVTVKIFARVPVSGEDLGTKEATITALSFDVKADVLGTVGPKPQVWKEGVGLVTVEKGIAVFQNVGLRAVVTPASENLRYKWTLNEDSHFVSGSTSSEIRVNRSQTGTCEATVVVTDKDGIELGRGTASFNVSISQEKLNTAAKSAESAKKLTEAKTISRKGEIDEAIKLADQAATLNPKNTEAKTLSDKLRRHKETIETQIKKTLQLMSESNFVEAQKALIVAKNLNPYYKPIIGLEKELGERWRKFDAGVREGLGNVRLANEKKDFQKALDLAQKLRSEYQLTPSSQKDLTNYERWAKTHEAEKERQREILARGQSKFDQGNYAGAIKDFDVMYQNFNNYWNINIDPEPKKYGDLRAESVKRQKRIAQIVPSIKRTIEYNAKNEVLLNQSLKHVEELLSYQPNNSEFQEYRSTINQLLRNKAKEATINPIMKRGNNAYQSKNYKSAIREYDKVIKISPDYAEAYRRRAMAKRQNGDKNGALRDFNKTIELAPDNYQAFLGRGVVHREMKNTDEAMNDFTRGIKLNPKYANGYFYRGYLKLGQKDYPGAIADLDQAIRLNPKDSSSYINRGLAKSRLGDSDGAFRDYNQAILVNPKNSLAYNNRGTIKEQKNDLEGAQADYKKALQLDPNNKYARNNLKKINTKISKNLPTPLTGKEVEIANINNIGAVRNRPTAPTTVTFRNSYMVTFIQTYHWNNGRGTTRPGTISLRHSNGKIFGPWKAIGQPGQGGVRNAYWQVGPNTVLPAGTYTIMDSDPSTWSQNARSGGKGFAIIKGYAVSKTDEAPPARPERMRISVTYVNNSRNTVHIFAMGERFSSENRLSPGGKRIASGEGPKFTRLTVYAGSNGKVIHQISFNVVPNGKYTVTFGRNNKLTVR